MNCNLIIVFNGEMLRAQLMQFLKLKDRVNFTRKYIEPALDSQIIEMTQPDSPNSPTQKYRLTNKGLLLKKQLEATANE